jgi:hypothetical protein
MMASTSALFTPPPPPPSALKLNSGVVRGRLLLSVGSLSAWGVSAGASAPTFGSALRCERVLFMLVLFI